MTTKLKDIPKNPNPLEVGAIDPSPEQGKGGTWRAIVSWVKGLF